MIHGNASNVSASAAHANAAHDIALPLAALVKLQAEAHTLRLPSAKATRSRQAGAYASPQRGRGMAFAEVRQYQPGDDIRAIDWRVTARRQQAHTKIYEEERERPVLLLCDLSPSLFFASTGAYKQVRAAQATAMLAWVALFGGDRVGGLVFNGQLLTLQRPAGRKTSVLRLLDNLAHLQHQPGQFHPTPSAPLAEPGSLDNALAEACRVARTGSRIFIISDFMQLSDHSAGLMGKLAQHNSVSAVHISDPLEQALPRHGQFAVASAIGPLWFDAADNTFRQAWQQRMNQHQERLQHCLRVAAVTRIDVSTGEHPRLALRALMAGGGPPGMNTPNANNGANNMADNAANALQQLRDIHLPVSEGWWPPAPGWWLLAAAGLLCLVLAVRGWQRWQRRNRRWQAVQRELAALRAQTQTQNSPVWFSQLNALLKRAARDIHPLQPVVALSGDDWVAFLQHSSDNAVEADLVTTMVNACWQPHNSCDPQQALAFAGRWLQRHKKQLRGAP